MPEARPIAMTATFNIQMGTQLMSRQAVVAKFDGTNPCLAVGTSGGRVVVHDGHDTSSDPVRFLNINRQTTALAAGAIQGKKQEALFVGSQSAVFAYNVTDNSDIFFKDVGDGVNAMAYGTVGTLDIPTIIVGGNCSVVGFDAEGEEKYWSVTGDNVRAMALLPWVKDGRHSVVVGSDDNEIRVFNGDEVMCKMTETAPPVQLMPTLHPGRFIYALANGTVGVYDQQSRTWRTKSKHKIESVVACDVDFDGVAEIMCGWSNGKFEVRSDAGQRNGEASFKDKFGSAVSNVLSSDYRGEGRANPLVCSFDGEVRGYVAVETSHEEVLEDHDQKTLEKLMQEKQTLSFELSQFQKQIETRAEMKAEGSGSGSMPAADAKVSCRLRPNADAKAIDLVLGVSGGAILQGATVTAEVIFGAAESIFLTADHPSETLTGTLQLDKDISADLKIAAIVGFPGADCFQCHELTVRLPKFAMYVPVKEFPTMPSGVVTARVNERVNRLVMWAQSCFNGYSPAEEKPANFVARFVSLRDGAQLMVETTTANGGELHVRSDSMEIAGDIVTDLGQYLGLTELSTTCDFPQDFAKFQDVITKVDEYNAVRMKLTGEMADSAQLVKALVIKAEDARILDDMPQMKRMYGSLYEVNRELMGEFMKRSNNYTELLAVLKEVNVMIQKASKFRIGQPKTTLVTECRNAIKTNQMQSLPNIIRTGAP